MKHELPLDAGAMVRHPSHMTAKAIVAGHNWSVSKTNKCLWPEKFEPKTWTREFAGKTRTFHWGGVK